MLKLYWRCLPRKARRRTTEQGRERGKMSARCWSFKLSQLHNKTQLTAGSLRSSSGSPHGVASQYGQPGGGGGERHLPTYQLSLPLLVQVKLARLPHVQVMLPSSSCSHWKRQSQSLRGPGPASAQGCPFSCYLVPRMGTPGLQSWWQQQKQQLGHCDTQQPELLFRAAFAGE